MAFVQLTPTDDSYIYQLSPNTNFGTSTFLFTGSFVQPNSLYRSLLKFDIFSSISPSSVILNAFLELFVYRKDLPDAAFSPQIVDVFSNDSDFSEFTVTWNNAPSITATPYAVTITDADVGAYIHIDITGLVSDWVNAVIPNYGVTLVGIEDMLGTLIGYFSKEWGISSQTPYLSVEYTTGSGSGGQLRGIQAQLTDAPAGTIPDNATIIFDTVLLDQSDAIDYNSATGEFTISTPGNYYVSWWVATDSASESIYVSFSLFDGANDILSMSPITSGQLHGNALIHVPESTEIILTLVNRSEDEIFLPDLAIQANIVLLEVS